MHWIYRKARLERLERITKADFYRLYENRVDRATTQFRACGDKWLDTFRMYTHPADKTGSVSEKVYILKVCGVRIVVIP